MSEYGFQPEVIPTGTTLKTLSVEEVRSQLVGTIKRQNYINSELLQHLNNSIINVSSAFDSAIAATRESANVFESDATKDSAFNDFFTSYSGWTEINTVASRDAAFDTLHLRLFGTGASAGGEARIWKTAPTFPCVVEAKLRSATAYEFGLHLSDTNATGLGRRVLIGFINATGTNSHQFRMQRVTNVTYTDIIAGSANRAFITHGTWIYIRVTITSSTDITVEVGDSAKKAIQAVNYNPVAAFTFGGIQRIGLYWFEQNGDTTEVQADYIRLVDL